MSLSTAVTGLRNTVAELTDAVAELAMIVQEDRPGGTDLAVVDHLGEMVSELQGDVAGAAATVAGLTDPRRLPDRLPVVDEHLARAADRYWRDLRGYEPVAQLRRSAQGRGGEWRSWPGSVAASLQRCETPLGRAGAEVRSAWREVGELLVLYLPVSPADISSLTARAPEEIR